MKKRQITLGSALDGFEPTPQSPVSASLDLEAGIYFAESNNEILIIAAQVAGPFPSVSVPGRGRWDLVYLDETGAVQVELGAEQILPVADYTGAPGFGTSTTANKVLPIAYIYVDESGAVSVDDADVTDLRPYIGRDERGAVGDLATDDSTGAGGILGTNWKGVPIDHRHPPNVDAINPAGIDTTASPGVLDIYARRDHVHILGANARTQVNTPLALASTCLWGPRSNKTAGNPNVRIWVLAQFAGRAQNAPDDDPYWFLIGPSFLHTKEFLTLFPIDLIGSPGNIGPGQADDTNPTGAASVNSFLYVYVIGVPNTSTYALVYSTNPPNIGPGLTDASFTGPGYSYWRFVTCIEMSATSGLAVAARKRGDTVVKEWPTGTLIGIGNRAGHSEDLYWATGAGSITVQLNEHVSPAGYLVFMNWQLVARAGAVTNARLYVRQVAGGVPDMGRQDQPDALVGVGSDAIKTLFVSNQNTTQDQYVADGFWMPLDIGHQINIEMPVTIDGGGAAQVVAYKEVPDGRFVDHAFT
jgi:hypothetical protein